MSVNKVILLGRVGADPEVKYMPSGNAVVNLSIATNRKFKNQDSGNYEDKTEWHRVVFFNKPAETIGQYVKKGQQLYVEGRLQTRKWQDKDGNDRYTTEVILQGYNCNLTLLDSRNNNSQVSDNSQEMDQSKPIEENSFGNQSGDSEDLDEDIPF